MPIWISAVLVPVVIVAVNLAAQFYFKWVPDIKDQKRHVVRAFFWLLNIAVFAMLGCIFYLYSQHKGAVDAAFVLRVAMIACLLVLHIGALLALRFMNLLLPLHRAQGSLDGGFLGIMRDVVKALEVLARAPELSEETTRALHILLYGDREITSQLESERKGSGGTPEVR